MGGIYCKREYNLIGTLLVVCIEKFRIIAFQRVTIIDHFVTICDTICIVCFTCIYLGIEIHLSKEGPGCSFGSTAIFSLAAVHQVTVYGFQFTFNIREYL